MRLLRSPGSEQFFSHLFIVIITSYLYFISVLVCACRNRLERIYKVLSGWGMSLYELLFLMMQNFYSPGVIWKICMLHLWRLMVFYWFFRHVSFFFLQATYILVIMSFIYWWLNFGLILHYFFFFGLMLRNQGQVLLRAQTERSSWCAWERKNALNVDCSGSIRFGNLF